MARIRSVKPEFWGDRKLARLVSRDARLLYVALWNQADEHARLQGDPRFIKGNCFPYDDDIDLADIDRLVGELATAGRVLPYQFEGDPYLHLPKLADHQRLEPDKVPSRLPAPPDPSVTQPDPDPDLSVDANQSAPRTDESAPDADTNALLYVAGSREHVAGGRYASRELACVADTPPQDDPTSSLLIEHVHAYAKPPPIDAQTKVKTEIMRLVAEGIEPERIRSGLAKLRDKGLAASLLPQLVSEATPTRRRATTDDRAAAGLELAEQLRAEGR